MNVSQTSGASAAWMLQKLFQSPDATTSTTTAEGAERQKMPGADGRNCKAGGAAAPSMSGGTMSAMVSMQMQAPSASGIASDLIGGLDTDGDGEVSADEIATAFSTAGLDSSGVANALGKIDSDGNGALSASELTDAVSSDTAAHRPKGPPPGGPPPAKDVASDILSAFDTNEDSGLSISEILSALGDSGDATSASSVFASLDPDGNGSLNADELTSAIQKSLTRGYQAYAQAAELA